MRIDRNPETNKFRSVTLGREEYQALLDDSGGVCVSCGEEAYGVEPDARKATCEGCDKPAVYGIEELLLMGRAKIGAP